MMHEEILVRIISPAIIVLECKAEIVTIPGEYGEFGVLPNHISMIAHLNPGIVKVCLRNTNFEYFIYGGMAQVRGGEVNVATEFAVELKSVHKTEIIDKINSYKEEIAIETDSDRIRDISHDLERYESLLSFLQ